MLLSLPLGPDQEHASAAGNGIRHGLQRLVHQRHRLGEVEDVDVVAVSEDDCFIFGFQRCV